MLKFNFRYQNLLDVKEKYEEFAKVKLGKAKKRLDDEEEKLTDIESDRGVYQKNISTKIQEGIDIGYLKICNSYIDHLNQKRNEQLATIKECNQEVNKMRENVLIASKEKKVFEKLKERDKNISKLLEKKAENLLLDQLVTYKNFERN